MRHYPKYLVKAEDEFESFNFPQLERDIIIINKASVDIPQTLKADILISYTKNHSLKNEWISANPEFAELVTAGAVPTSNIASLFEASTQNSNFQQQLEKFLKVSIE